MILKAAEDFNIDIDYSIIIGDRLSDLEAGKRAGIKKFVHVLTGHGYKERNVIIEKFNYYNLTLLNNLTFSLIKIYYLKLIKSLKMLREFLKSIL